MLNQLYFLLILNVHCVCGGGGGGWFDGVNRLPLWFEYYQTQVQSLLKGAAYPILKRDRLILPCYQIKMAHNLLVMSQAKYFTSHLQSKSNKYYLIVIVEKVKQKPGM